MKDKPKTKASAAAAANAASRRKNNNIELSVDNDARVRSVLKVCRHAALYRWLFAAARG